MGSKCEHGITYEKGWCDHCMMTTMSPSALTMIVGHPKTGQLYTAQAWADYHARKQPSVVPLPGTKLVGLPPGAGRVVALTVFKDQLYAAFEFGVWRRTERDSWEQVLSVGQPQGMPVSFP